jgi:hypothetical protein
MYSTMSVGLAVAAYPIVLYDRYGINIAINAIYCIVFD